MQAKILSTASEHGFMSVQMEIDGETVNGTGADVNEAVSEAFHYVTDTAPCVVLVSDTVAAYVDNLRRRIAEFGADGCYVDDLRAELASVASGAAAELAELEAYEIEQDAEQWEAEQAHVRAAEVAYRNHGIY